MDNVASEVSDMLIKICKTLMKKLTEGRRYLKGNYRVHCTTDDRPGVADHCIKYADEKANAINQIVEKYTNPVLNAMPCHKHC